MADPGVIFQTGGWGIPKWGEGAPTYYFGQFIPKTAWNWKKTNGVRPYRSPTSPGSANVGKSQLKVISANPLPFHNRKGNSVHTLLSITVLPALSIWWPPNVLPTLWCIYTGRLRDIDWEWYQWWISVPVVNGFCTHSVPIPLETFKFLSLSVGVDQCEHISVHCFFTFNLNNYLLNTSN